MWIPRNLILPQYLPRKPKHILLLIVIIFIFIFIYKWKSNFNNENFCSYMRYYNITNFNDKYYNLSLHHQQYHSDTNSNENGNYSSQTLYNNEIMDGYLVWSSKCHIPSRDPIDPSIIKFVKQIEYETCSDLPLLSSIIKETNDTFSLIINNTIAKNYENFTCCWAPIFRPDIVKPLIKNLDSSINEGNCMDFQAKILLPSNLEIVMVSCRENINSNVKVPKILYKNIHAIMNPAKVLKQQNNLSQSINNNFYDKREKMSILILGIDSISRLNFLRSLPKTEKYLRETGWFNLKGYNKMGLNTFPNLMAILTGHNESGVDSVCKPNKPYGLDNCPFLWHGFKKAGYVTAYGEDYGPWSTFNYEKVGFIYPPTDYYLRAYIVATEKLLEPRYKFVNMYCTGPELAVNRILDYASNFAKKFLHVPYFGFFWANSVSHNDLNAISSMDNYFVNYFKDLEQQGVFNDTMVIFLSDHGLRFGKFRETYLGWYEERLPFIYFHIPYQQYNENSHIFEAIKINEHRLTSPYDLYETLRDILMRSQVTMSSSSGCPKCQTLFRPIPNDRTCADAGISPHWCTCETAQLINEIVNGTIAVEGVKTFLNYVNNMINQYKNERYQQLCAQLRLKKIHYINQIMENIDDINVINKKYSFRIEVMPGDGMFEYLIYVNVNGNFTVRPEEINRINSYANDSKCLDNANKKYCYCLI